MMKKKAFIFLACFMACHIGLIMPIQQAHAFVPGTYNQFMTLTEPGVVKVAAAVSGGSGIGILLTKYLGYASGPLMVAMMVFDASSLAEDEVLVTADLTGTVTGSGLLSSMFGYGTSGNHCVGGDDYYTDCAGNRGLKSGTFNLANWPGEYVTGGYSRYDDWYPGCHRHEWLMVCLAGVPNSQSLQNIQVVPASGQTVQVGTITFEKLQQLDVNAQKSTGAAPTPGLIASAGNPAGVPLVHLTDYTTVEDPVPDPDPIPDPIPDPVTEPTPTSPVTGTCTECARTKYFSSVMTKVMEYASTVPMLAFLDKLVLNPTGQVQYVYTADSQYGPFVIDLQAWNLDMFIGIIRFFVVGGAFISAYYIIFD